MPLVGELLPIKHSNPLPNNVTQTHFCHSNSIKWPQVKLTSGLWQVFVCSLGIRYYITKSYADSETYPFYEKNVRLFKSVLKFFKKI